MYTLLICLLTFLLLCAVIIISVTAPKSKNVFNEKYLSISTTQGEKGIAAVMIVFHHLSQAIPISVALKPLQYIGFIMVSMFFFVSGYGLVYGVENKQNYLNGFLRKRMVPILIPYWIVTIVYSIIHSLKGKFFSPYQYVLSFLGISQIFNCWFVTAILLMYLLFLIAYTLCKTAGNRIIVLCIEIFGYVIICNVLGIESYYSASVSAFFFGTLWYYYQNSFTKWIRTSYYIRSSIIFCLFLFLFTGRLALSWIGIDSEWVHVPLRNIISVLFILCLITITQKIEIRSRILSWLGSISYELYLIHGMLITFLSRENESIFVLFVLFGGLILATGLRFFDKTLVTLFQQEYSKQDIK